MAPPNLPARLFENAYVNLFISPSRRKLQRYYNEITRESLWVDLERYFHPSKPAIQTLENKGLSAIFDACCTDNTDQQVWNENSFQNYLGIAHPQIATSKETVHLLWNIFHYYAYHPFAPKPSEDTVDADGFRRAIMLLSARCSDLLGTLEHDYHWTMLNDHVRNRNIERIFRIIGQPSIATSLEDVMDALASAQPCFVYCELPSPEQVEVAARRLIGEDSIQAEFRVSREDLSTLMAVLLRLNITEAKSRAFSYHGSFDEANSAYDEMVEIVVDRMIGQGANYMESGQIHSALEPLQNFYGRFQLLWAILFQPLHRDKPQKSGEPTGLIPHDVRGVLSLLLLSSDINRLSSYSTGPYAWETVVQPPKKPSDLTVTDLTGYLLEQSTDTRLMIVTIDETSSSPKIVWGVLFIGPLSFSGNSDDWTDWDTSSAHIFQIRHQLRWVNQFDSPEPLRISINGRYTESFTTKAESPQPPDREAKCIYLQLDWNTKSILLSRSSNNDKQRQNVSAEDVFVNGEVNYLREVDWETSTTFDEVQILCIPGATSWNSGVVKPCPDQSRAWEQAISRDELKSRIQGFGST